MPYNSRLIIQGGCTMPPMAPLSTFNPNSISSLVAWFDATGLTTNADNVYGTVDVSGNITKWKNLKTGATDDLRNSANYPTLAATAGPSSKPAVMFTASSTQHLLYYNNSSPSTLAYSTYTAFFVGKRVTNSARIIGFSKSASSSADYLLWYDFDDKVYFTSSTTALNSTSTFDVSEWDVFTTEITGASTGNLWINNSTQTLTSSAAAGAGTIDAFGKAGAAYADGYFSEVILFSGNLSSGDRNSVWSYLVSKWGSFPQ